MSFKLNPLTGQFDILGTSGGGSGTVTSVGITASNLFNVSGSPVTTSGTLTLSLANKTTNWAFLGPVSGPAGTPSFRALVPDDLALGGTSNQVLKTDGSGTLSWTGASTGFSIVSQVTVAAWTAGGGATPMPFTIANVSTGTGWNTSVIGTNAFVAPSNGIYMIQYLGASNSVGPIETAIFYGLNGGPASIELGNAYGLTNRAGPNVTGYLYMNASDTISLFSTQDMINMMATFSKVN